MDYSSAEQTLIDALITAFPTKLRAETVVAGDFDSAWVYASSSSEWVDFCILDFGGAQRIRRASTDRKAWSYVAVCTLFIKFVDSATIEDDIRAYVDSIPNIIDGRRRLDNGVFLATVESMEKPERIAINEIPYYLLGFVVEMIMD